MTDLADFRRVAAADRFLCIVATTRADGTVQTSLVNAGVITDPDGAGDVVAFVGRGGSRKLANLRARPAATVVARAGWDWAAVEGMAELVGPDDATRGLDAEGLRLLLRDIFTAAGGTHDNWPDYDATMVRERRAAVLVRPARIYSNG